jgi:ABC-type bacteriocin/lantibiotic exporter with double-glycine peptidase domain
MELVKPYLPRDQALNYTCGPVCIANALALYGLPTSQEECQGACGVGADGTTTAKLMMGVRKMGFYPIKKILLTKDRKQWNKLFKWMGVQTDLGRYVICSINGNGTEGHWILIIQVLPKGILVWDPSENFPELIQKKNLFKAWWNVNFPGIESETTGDGDVTIVSLSPRSKLTKRAVEIKYKLLHPPVAELPIEKTKNAA